MALLSIGTQEDWVDYDPGVEPLMTLVGEGSPGDALIIASGTDIRPITPGGGAGPGDVARIGSTIDNRLARWNGADAEIQNSGVSCDDSDNLSGIGTITGGASNIAITNADGNLLLAAFEQDGATNGQVMTWNDGGSVWEPQAAAGGGGPWDISDDTNLAVVAPIVLTDDTLSHAVSGVGAGTYLSVTVDVRGHVTGGTNPAPATDWANPGTIGSSTPNTGAFTTLRASGDFNADGAAYFVEYLYHEGDTDTYLRLVDDRFRLFAGGINFIDASEGGQDILRINVNQVDMDIEFSALSLDKALWINGLTGNVEITNDLNIIAGALHVTLGTLHIAQDIGHEGDTNTFMRFVADEIRFYAGNIWFCRYDETTQNITVFNENGVDIDFRVESESVIDAIFLEADGSSEGNGLLSVNVPFEAKLGFRMQTVAEGRTIAIDASDDLTINDEDEMILVTTGTSSTLNTIVGGREGQFITLKMAFLDTCTFANGASGAGTGLAIPGGDLSMVSDEVVTFRKVATVAGFGWKQWSIKA